ncbi:MAG: hypothetical protein ACK4Q4_05125 [Rhodocyclaceae bacterium]
MDNPENRSRPRFMSCKSIRWWHPVIDDFSVGKCDQAWIARLAAHGGINTFGRRDALPHRSASSCAAMNARSTPSNRGF